MPKRIHTEVQLAEEMKKYDRVIRAVEADLQEDGLEFPDRPGGDIPQWPSASVNDIQDKELFKLHFKFREFGRHIAGKAVKARSARDAAKKKLGLVEAHVRRRVSGSNKEERDDNVLLDALVQETSQRLLYFETMYRMLTDLADMFRKDTDTISRQMTQREKEKEQGDRGRRAETKGRRRRYSS